MLVHRLVHAQYQSQHHAADNQTGTTVGDKWQGQTLGGQKAGAHTHVNESLARENQRGAVADVGAEQLTLGHGASRHPENAPDQGGEQPHDQQRTSETGLFRPDRKYEIGVRLGQIEQLLHAVAQADAYPLAPAEGNQ